MMQANVYGHTMHLDPEDTVITPCLLNGQTFERMTVAALRFLVKPGDVVVDGGANIGYFTLLLARLVGPSGQVFAFEPDPRSFELLRRNVEANGYDNVVLSDKALGRVAGRAKIYLNAKNRGDNRLMAVAGWESVAVEVTTLDAAVSSAVSFIKLDLQGSEVEALEGAKRLLANPSISVACELCPEGLVGAGTSPEALFAVLASFPLFLPDERLHVIQEAGAEQLLARAREEVSTNLFATKGKQLYGVKLPSCQFIHGLGDCANAAHLFALYRQRGHDLTVHCQADKELMFMAAGCEMVKNDPPVHAWEHPPGSDHASNSSPWSGNKVAWNVSQQPFPNIGSRAECWDDLLSIRLDLERYVPDAVRANVHKFLAGLPRPVILLHTKGNTGPGAKDYPDELTQDLYRRLLDQTEGSLVLLDWDNRVPRLAHGRVRHLTDDWQTLDLVELYELIQHSDLVIGVDSGVLHFTRFTQTPAIGVWTHHHPSHFALPRLNTVHLVSNSQADLNRQRRLEFNLIEAEGRIPNPSAIADTAAFMLGRRKLLAEPGPDAVLHHILANAKDYKPNNGTYCDRHNTLAAFLGMLKERPRPLVVETGRSRPEDNRGPISSASLLGYFLKHHGGELNTVGSHNGAAESANGKASGLPVRVHLRDASQWLAGYAGDPIVGLYLDSEGNGTLVDQEACLQEVQLALPKLAHGGSILIDGTPWQRGRYVGRGELAVRWLLEQGYRIKAAGYQVLLTK